MSCIPGGVRGQVSLTSAGRFSSFISNVSMVTDNKTEEKERRSKVVFKIYRLPFNKRLLSAKLIPLNTQSDSNNSEQNET